MGEFIFFCPHCEGKLRVDDSWAGRRTRCPSCGKEISFAVPPAPLAGAGQVPEFRPDSDSRKDSPFVSEASETAGEEGGTGAKAAPPERWSESLRRYFFGNGDYYFGRLLVVLLWVLALAVPALAVWNTVRLRRDLENRRTAIELRYHLPEQRQAAVRGQRELTRIFLHSTALLSSPESVFAVPPGTVRPPDSFSPVLQSELHLQNALKTVREYRRKSEEIHQAVRQFFVPLLEMLNTEESGGNGRKQSGTGPGLPPVRAIVLRSGDENSSFYKDEQPLLRVLPETRRSLENAVGKASSRRSEEMRKELDRVLQSAWFVQNFLLPSGPRISVVRAGNQAAGSSAVAGVLKKVPPGTGDGAALGEQIARFAAEVRRNWRLDAAAEQLEGRLEQLLTATRRAEEEKLSARTDFREALWQIWLGTLILMVVLPGVADCLRAHFDRHFPSCSTRGENGRP